MLTFEWDEVNETLLVHGDVEGLESLVDHLRVLVDSTPDNRFDHTHLMTADWGGTELSSEAKTPGARTVDHVKIYCWKGTTPHM